MPNGCNSQFMNQTQIGYNLFSFLEELHHSKCLWKLSGVKFGCVCPHSLFLTDLSETLQLLLSNSLGLLTLLDLQFHLNFDLEHISWNKRGRDAPIKKDSTKLNSLKGILTQKE